MKVFFRYCVVGHVVATAFIFGENISRNPRLSEIVDKHVTKRIAMNIEIGKETDSSRLAIRNVVVDLSKNYKKEVLEQISLATAAAKKSTRMFTNDNKKSTHVYDDWEYVEMPGKDGIHPDVSGGVHPVNVVKEGEFVTGDGVQTVKTTKGSWELNWMKDAHAGSLVLGFEIPEDYTRNDCTLPKGNVYMNFPVWTKDTLDFARERKKIAFQKAKESLEERNAELIKMQETSNLFMKVLHYRNAYAAIETYTLQPLKHYAEVVPAEDEIIELQDDIILTARGRIWTKEFPRGPQYNLGTVKLSLAE